MVRIVLIRPGPTDYDRQGRIQGALDIPLNEDGAAAVARTVEELRDKQLIQIFASESEPALATAREVADQLGVKLKTLDKLKNVNLGLWQGMTVDEVKRKQPKVYRQWQETPENVRPPEGEMLADVRQRIQGCLGKVIKTSRKGPVGLVVPEPLASVVRSYVRHDDLGDLWKASLAQSAPGANGCSWEVLEFEPVSLAPTA
jgi:broad specificity phosphatase PhoE